MENGTQDWRRVGEADGKENPDTSRGVFDFSVGWGEVVDVGMGRKIPRLRRIIR